MKTLSMKVLLFILAALVVSSAVFVHVSIRKAQAVARLHDQKMIELDDQEYRRQIAAGQSHQN